MMDRSLEDTVSSVSLSVQTDRGSPLQGSNVHAAAPQAAEPDTRPRHRNTGWAGIQAPGAVLGHSPPRGLSRGSEISSLPGPSHSVS